MAETISKPIEDKSKHDKTKNGKAATFAIRGPLSPKVGDGPRNTSYAQVKGYLMIQDQWLIG